MSRPLLVLVVAAAVGCRSSAPPNEQRSLASAAPAPAPAASVAPSVPAWADRWWRIVDATAERSTIGGRLRCARTELVFYDPTRDQLNRKPATIERCDDNRCAWRLAGESLALRGTLQKADTGAQLVIEGNGDRLVFRLESEDESRGRQLDALLGERALPANVCDRATSCCEAAVAVLKPGSSCNADRELGVPHDPEICARFLRAARTTFDAKKLPLPSACE